MATLKIEDVVRINSAKGKTYLALKDGKPHQIKTVLAMLKKEGIEHKFPVVYGLGRILRAQFAKQVVVDREKGTFQITPFAKARAATKAPAKRKAAKSTVTA